MRTRRYLACYLSSLAFGLILGSAVTAHSWYSRQHGSACRVALGRPADFIEWGNNSTTASLVIACAVPDNNLAPKEDTGTLYVAVDDLNGASPVSAFRCVEYWNADGAACGIQETSCQPANPLCFGGRGLDFIKPPNTGNDYWTNNGQHFAYVGLVLPAKDGSARSKVKSITITNEVQ